MTALLALLLAAAPPQLSAVRTLRVLPVEDRTEIVIGLDGPVEVTDFVLDDPDRLVLDLKGARQALPTDRYSGIDRGGVLGVRSSQYQPDVVRLVIELHRPVRYELTRDANAVHVSFHNPDGVFAPWSSGLDDAPANAVDDDAVERETTARVERTASARTPAPARARPVVPEAAQEPHISVSFENTPILDVIQTFAAFANRSIVAGQNISGNVTADINNQPWDLALEAILEAHGFAVLERQSGILQVVKLEDLRKQEQNEELVTREFRIRYTSVDSVLTAVKDLLSQRGQATKNTSTNTLIVTDGRSVVDRIAPLIEQLDARTPQVTIAAKIIFVDRTALEELGVTYDLKDSRGSQLNSVVQGYVDKNGDGVFEPDEATDQDVILLGGNSIAALANARARLASPSLRLVSTLLLGRHSLITFLDALESLQLSDIQAAPVVTVLDNREAQIQVGEDTPIRTIDLGAGGSGGGQAGQSAFPRATVTFKPTGVILKVTPHVTGDEVVLELHAERSNIAAAPSDLGVTFQKQASDTQVLVKDGETAVIAGLTVIEKSKARSGIPFLMDLPVLGSLFSTTSDRETKQDLLIMVTPHIVK